MGTLTMLCLVCSALIPLELNAFSFFPKSPISKIDGLDDISSFVASQKISQPVVEVGDWNGDKFSDVLTWDATERAVSVYLWDHDGFQFRDPTKFPLGEGKITNFVLRDFNRDGLADMFLSYTNGTMVVYLQSGEVGLSRIELPDLLSGSATLVGNVFGEGYVDIVGIRKSDGARTVWKGPNFGMAKWEASDPRIKTNQLSSISNVDIDGDCRGDLVVISVNGNGEKWMELWIARKSDGTEVPLDIGVIYELNSGVGIPSFADFDRDGDLDLVAPYSSRGGKAYDFLVAMYNTRAAVSCTSGACCEKGTGFGYTPPGRAADPRKDSGEFLVFQPLPAGAYLTAITLDGIDIPPMLRIADYDVDSFVDLLVVTTPSDSDQGVTNSSLLQNVACTEVECGAPAARSGKRMFRAVTSGSGALTTLPSPALAFFFCFDDEGECDIMVVQRDSNRHFAGVKALLNNYYNDAFFFRAAGLNGAVRNGETAYGGAYPGAIAKFSWMDIDSSEHTLAAVQLPSSEWMRNDPHYSNLGVGRTNSYIDTYYYGIHLRSLEKPYYSWLGIIPNAQVFAIPNPLLEPADWTIELYILPSSATFWSAAVTATALIVIGIPIIILWRREKKEDEEEKNAKAHAFLF